MRARLAYLNGQVGWLPARVPGDVRLDLMAAGILPDLYVGDNLDYAAWLENADIWYRLHFHAPEFEENRRLLLVAHGLDTFATISLSIARIRR